MLFLSDAIQQSRERVLREVDGGRITTADACRQLLALDPIDFIAFQWLGQLRREQGDLSGAEQYFWQGLDANPWDWASYMSLAQVIPTPPALCSGLIELACNKLLLEDEAVAEAAAQPLLASLQTIEGLGDLSVQHRLGMLADMLLDQRAQEPADVTARLLPYRLIHLLHEGGGLDAEPVNLVLQQGASIAPLLVGTLRAWARSCLPEETEPVVEGALALLGEVGDPQVIPNLLEFVSLEDFDISSTAQWALDRVLDRHPGKSATIIAGLIPALDVADRIAVATSLALHPALDSDARLITSLSENLGQIPKELLESLFALLVSRIMESRGRAGAEVARGLLQRNKGILSGQTQRSCEQLIAAFEAAEFPEIPPFPRSPWTVYDICAGEAIWDDEDLDDGSIADELLEEGNGGGLVFDDAPYVSDPVPRHEPPGRNDPCWCGSGKKYKKCHLNSDQGADEESLATPPASRFDALRSRLGTFMTQLVPPNDLHALRQFFGKDLPEPFDDTEKMALVDWLIHDYVSPKFGRGIMVEFLRRHGAGLGSRERAFVESSSRSFVSLYEAQEVRTGSGLVLKDLFTNQAEFVHDVSLSNQLVRWDGLFGRVIDGDRGRELSGIGTFIPHAQLAATRQWMEEDRGATGLPWPEYLKQHWPRIRRQNADFHRRWPSNIEVVNEEGEKVLFAKSVYQILDHQALAAALRNCAILNGDAGETHYRWLGGANVSSKGVDLPRALRATIRIKGVELVLQCDSKERSDRGKDLLAKIAGQSLRHLRDEFTTPKELQRKVADGPSPAGHTEDIPPEIRQELISKIIEDHYSNWPRKSLPALQGRTPLEAVKTPEGRLQVVELLHAIENAEERKRKDGERFYDVAKLRAALGIPE